MLGPHESDHVVGRSLLLFAPLRGRTKTKMKKKQNEGEWKKAGWDSTQLWCGVDWKVLLGAVSGKSMKKIQILVIGPKKVKKAKKKSGKKIKKIICRPITNTRVGTTIIFVFVCLRNTKHIIMDN